jgi:anti-anti-sigma factor
VDGGEADRGFTLEVVRLGPDRVQVAVAGDVDLATAPAMVGTVLEQIRHPKRVTLDLSQVTFIDSSGVHPLLGLAATASHSGAPLVILRFLQPQVQRVLEVSSTLRLLPFALA